MLANSALRHGEGNAAPAPSKEGGSAVTIVESRFGRLEVAAENVLTLPNGLLGFATYRDFALAALPEGRHPQFRVLQCLSDKDLAFLVAPLNLESGAVDEADLAEACANLGIVRDRLAVLLIVTVRRDAEGAHVSVNMRAPLFVDTGTNVGRQYVMPNNKYSIRHTL